MEKSENFKINSIYLENITPFEKENMPFPIKICRNFIENEELLKEFVKSLKETIDLDELPSNENKPIIKSFVKFIKENVKDYIKKVTGFELTDKVTLTGSSYKKGDYLLPHNDQISNRKVAFILYLNDKDKTIEGGKLNLFDIDINEFPKNIVYTEKPEFNKFNFFEVSSKSWHEVEEILNDDVERLSVNGWFHIKDDNDIVIKNTSESIKEIIREDFDLSLFLSNRMLDDKYMTIIKKRFEKNSYVALSDFLRNDVLESINKELKEVKFKREGPWHKKNIMILDDNSLSEESILKKFLRCSQSDTFMKYFSFITGLNFVDIPGVVTSYEGIEEEDKNSVEESIPVKKSKLDLEKENISKTEAIKDEITMCHKFYRISKKCYICGDDQVAEKASQHGWSLDVKFFFTDTEWDSKNFGGYTSYITPYNEEEILRIEPLNNICFLVFKEPKCFDITKYVQNNCGNNYMNCLSISYMGLNNDFDEQDDESLDEECCFDEEFEEEENIEDQSNSHENFNNIHRETDNEE